MTELIFASNNTNKLQEMRQIFPPSFQILSLEDVGIRTEIPETGNTILDNSFMKADYIFNLTGKNCFADDTGLEVEALNNEPGVFSARYAGENADAAANISLLLKNLKGVENRNACFKTCIALNYGQRKFCFIGTVKGTIALESRGHSGFGYDPIFIHRSSVKTFAELTVKQKNKISHRKRAISKMIRFLESEGVA